MKINSIITCVCACLFSISLMAKSNTAVISGNSNTDLGKYTISLADEDFSVKGESLKTYLVDYENGEQEVYISLDHDKNCRNFIVRSKYFEVQYKCKKDKFGVTYLQSKYTSLDPMAIFNRIDKDEFARQKVITKANKTDEELMGLIASYFPTLLTEKFEKALF